MKRFISVGVAFILLCAVGLVLNIFDIKIFIHIGRSLFRMIIGYVLSVGIGLTIAVILGSSRYLRMMFKPVLSFFISIPTITWVPLLLVVTGISEKTIIIAIFLGSFFAIVFNTLDGFDNVQESLIKAGKIMGYNRFELLFYVYVPASFNNILVGLKLGIAYSWRALVGAEMLGAAAFGLGYLVFASRKFYDLQLLIASLLFIGLLGYLLNRVIITFIEEKTITKWGLT